MRTPAAVRHQEINAGRIPGLFLKQFQMSNVKKGETVALLSDVTTRTEYVEAAFAAADDAAHHGPKPQ